MNSTRVVESSWRTAVRLVVQLLAEVEPQRRHLFG